MNQYEKLDKKLVSRFKHLPGDILRLLGLYLDIHDIISLCRLNKKIRDSITERGIFLRDLGYQRLSKHTDRLRNRDILKELSINNLEDAVIRGYLEKVKDIVKHFNNLDTFDEYRILLLATRRNYLDIVEYFIQWGADIHRNNENILFTAAKHGYLELVKYLVEHGATVNVVNDRAFAEAISNGHLEIVKYMILFGVDVHHELDYSLPWAAARGHLALVKYLTDCTDGPGIDIHEKGDLALRNAVLGGNLDVVKYLVKNGANINSQNSLLETPFTNAIACGHLDVVEYLVSQGAEVNTRALQVAREFSQKQIARYLKNIMELNKQIY